jgi:hypothetical protein
LEVEFGFGFRGEKREIARLIAFLQELERSGQHPSVIRAWNLDENLVKRYEAKGETEITQLHFSGYGEPCGSVMTDVFCKSFPQLEVGYRDNLGFDEDEGYNYIYSWSGSDTYDRAEWIFFGKYAAVDQYGDWIEEQEENDLAYWSKPINLAESLFCITSDRQNKSNYYLSRKEALKRKA